MLDFGDAAIVNCVLDEVLVDPIEMCRHQYGNYIVQHVLKRSSPALRARVAGAMKGNLLVLAKHKFASNVVEQCFTTADAAVRGVMLDEIIGPHTDAMRSPLVAMVRDQYANYGESSERIRS